ncbi:MAG: adenylate/guanylate cyclase domain-containing protein, partial [Leptospiraceae bacterium]|nr:adenylate/guanylate cyclase domain-containing protein [Leptospiraceae bacterium]
SLFWFALMCLSLGTRALISGERFLYIYDWSVIHRLEYFSFYFSVSAVAIYFHLLYPREYYKWISYAFAAAGFLFCFTLVFMPAVQYTRFLVIFQLITGLFILYAIAGMILATVRRREQVFVFLSGTLTVSFCVTNDVLYNNGIYLTGTNNLSPLGWILFVFSQSTLLGTRLTHAFRAVENLTENLRSQATSFRRFVPDQFLNVLSREQVTEIELGDSRNMQMSVLFADIRSFTTLSETMSTAENIRFLNSYLKRMEPCITGHGGFIDKFIGDAIMALFQEQNSDANQNKNETDYARRSVQSAIDMLAELEVYNNNRVDSGYLPISIGIGIHAGEV